MSKYVVNLKLEIIKAYVVVRMTEVLSRNKALLSFICE